MAFEWTPDLSVGDESVDRQHQEMFRRVYALVEAMQQRRARSAVQETFAFLEKYVIEHFDAELSLMTASLYPGTVAHHAEHQTFMRSYEDLKNAHLKIGASPAVVIELQRYVCRWLRSHIATTDKALGRFLLSRRDRVLRSRPTNL